MDEKVIKEVLQKVNLIFKQENIINRDSFKRQKRLPYHIIYIHINNINKKVYIGQTCNPYERWRQKGDKYKDSPKFWRAIQKYGWENFSSYLLDKAVIQEEANLKEKYYIELFQSIDDKKGYNVLSGGNNYVSELWQLPEYKEKMQQSFKKARKKTWENPEMAKYLQAQMQQGVTKFWSDPIKREERIKNLKGNKNPNSKAVINLETGRIFNTLTEAAKWAGLNCLSPIGANCRGERKSAGKHPITDEKLHWRYIERSDLLDEGEQRRN